MVTNKKSFLLVLLLVFFFNFLSAQKNVKTQDVFYKKEMQSLRSAIQKNFYNKVSGYYLIETDTAKRERKNGYLREYTYLWALCAMYQAVNEIEKVDPSTDLIIPMLQNINNYYDPAPPSPGYSDYIMKLKPGIRYYDDNQWIGITALDVYARTNKKSYLKQGKLVYDFMMSGCDTVLGGGIYWREGDTGSKNTCSNGPGVLVALQMYQATKEKRYFDSGLKIFNWTNKKLQAPSGLYYDNIRTKDGNVQKATLSYNTGTMLESYVYLYEITKDKQYLKDAKAIADSSLTFFYGREKFRDGLWFNAVLLRAYQHLLKYNNDTKYIMGFKKCLDYALKNDKNVQGLFTGRNGVQNLVEHGGMLEILARFALLETQYDLKGTKTGASK
jgi:rhamnogalacturonyl hydrolase YesR